MLSDLTKATFADAGLRSGGSQLGDGHLAVVSVRAVLAIAAPFLLASCYSMPVNKELPREASAYALLEPGASAYAAEPHHLQPNDTVTVTVYQEPDLSLEETAIDTDGYLSIPLLGNIKATGLTSRELAAGIEQRLQATGILMDPDVTVAVVTTPLRRITVEGEVDQPGMFPITGPTSLTQAIALARGTNRTAKLDEVLVFRTIEGQRMAARFNLKAIRAARAPDPMLAPDDIVIVGFSEVRGIWEDVLRTIPLIGVFRPFN